MSQPLHSNTAADGPPAPIGVLVVDDQFAVREGLARLLTCSARPVRHVNTAATGAEALLAAARLLPNVVVLDADLDGEDGLALIPQLSLTAGVLVLTSHGDPATRARAAGLGALAFIEKHQPAAELLAAIDGIGQRQAQGGQTSQGTLGRTSSPGWSQPPL